MRIALIVGINYYEHGGSLHGCVNDAHEVKAVLERHDGGAVNFDCRLLTGTGPTERVNRSELKDQIEQLFKADADIALFYFAGHGHIEATGVICWPRILVEVMKAYLYLRSLLLRIIHLQRIR